jgi:hypothetical protein
MPAFGEGLECARLIGAQRSAPLQDEHPFLAVTARRHAALPDPCNLAGETMPFACNHKATIGCTKPITPFTNTEK